MSLPTWGKPFVAAQFNGRARPCKAKQPAAKPSCYVGKPPVAPPMTGPVFGTLRPGGLDRAVIAATSALPDTWAGLRLAILLRRIVTMRLARAPIPALDVERWGLAMRLHPLDNGCEKNLLFTP